MVKRTPVDQSRRNAARRRRRVAARHRLAGRWAEQPAPMFTSGKITYEVGGYVAATPYGRTGPGQKAWNPLYLELTVVGCLSEKALADAGRTDVAPDVPLTWATIAHQLRSHDDYVPLATPLPMHLARLAADYVLPTEPDQQDG